ncbi:MAG: response regulator [Gemmataceae bacterium]|nr:response regulator [Gemmataceae bacterium]
MIYSWHWDKDGRILNFDPAFSSKFPAIIPLAGLEQQTQTADVEPVRKALTSAAKSFKPFSFECRFSGHSGVWTWFHGVAVPVPSAGGEIEFFCSGKEVYPHGQTVEEIQKKLVEAETASRAKSSFLANMSHEIRAPIQAVLGYSHILANPNLSQGEREKMTQAMEKSGHFLFQLVKDILDFSKIEAGKEGVEILPCSPWLTLNEVMDTVGLKALEKGLQVEVKALEAIPTLIHTDPVKLRQILVNLVGNAIKYTPRGKVSVDLFLQNQSESENTCLAFSILDQGPGLNPAQIAGLFQPFIRVNRAKTDRQAGTGLGLTITQRLAKLLGGAIQVTSSEGEGSCFTFLLPVGEKELQKRVEPGQLGTLVTSKKHQITSTLSLGMSARILLAEDSEDIQVYFRYLLEKEGLDVEVAGSGAEVMHAVLHQHFDLILLDIQMPDGDGKETARMLRDLGLKIPLLALTAMATKEDEEDCLAAGFDYFLTKPVDREKLLEALGYFLPKSKDDFSLQGKNIHSPGYLAKVFLDNLAERQSGFRDSLERQDRDALARILHQSRGAAGLFGYSYLAELSGNIENAARTGSSWPVMEKYYEEFAKEVTRIVQEKSKTPGS